MMNIFDNFIIRNNEEQFTLSNSQTYHHVMFIILLFIATSIVKTHLTMALQAGDWFWKNYILQVKIESTRNLIFCFNIKSEFKKSEKEEK